MTGSSAKEEKELERIFKAFANRRRLAIMRHIRERREATVGDIAEAIGLSFKATSKHLGVLTSAGVLDHEQQGLTMRYILAADMPSAARKVLALL